MELKAFVRQSIVDIMEAVHDAGCIIDKAETGASYDKRVGVVPPANEYENEGLKESEIEFDIGVIETQGKLKQAGGKIAIFNTAIGVTGNQSENSQVVNRIRFKVPIAYRFKRKLPVQKQSKRVKKPARPTSQSK